MKSNTLRRLALLLVLGLAVTWLAPTTLPAQATPDGPHMYFFWGEGCPHCAKEKEHIETWKEKYPELKIADFEVYNHPENRKKMNKMAERFGIERTGVPMTFIGMRYWVGFRPGFAEEMEKALKTCLDGGCLDPTRGVIETDGAGEQAPDQPSSETETEPTARPETKQQKSPPTDRADTTLKKSLNLPFFGEITITESQPLWLGTALIAFVDGFNPCSLWVLTLLLALVLRTESRKKTFLVGFTYLVITAAVYGAFIAGVFKAFQFIQHMRWIRFGVGTIALLFGLTNVKDFFAFKKGLSFSIPERFKPQIYRKLRELTHHQRSVPALIFYTALMALGITLVELPCTAGFPVIWNSFLTVHEIGAMTFLLLLMLYVLIYLLDELAIFLSVVITLDISRLEEEHGQGLKLFGGSLMVVLAGILIYDPHLMNDLLTTAYAFGGAVLISILLILVRKFLPEVQTDE